MIESTPSLKGLTKADEIFQFAKAKKLMVG